MKKTDVFLDRIYAYILALGGALGLFAAFVLSVEKVELLANPSFVPSCNLNPLLSCTSVMQSAQAEAFGFPNPYLGLIGFSAVIVVGMSLLAGAAFQRWYWRLFWLGTVFGITFVHWLAYQSIYNIGALCLYCILVWTATAPIFWYTTLRLWRNNSLPKPPNRLHDFLQNNHFTLLMLWYLAVLGAILNRFWYYFDTLI